MKRILFIIALEGFQDHEFSIPYEILKTNYEIIVAGNHSGTANGKFGKQVVIQKVLSDIHDVHDLDAVIFIGGPGAVNYQNDKNAHRLAKDILNKGKLLAAICIAPTILAKAGLLKGRKATVWNGDGRQGKMLQRMGADFTDEDVTIDDNLITANGPPAAEKFAEAIVNYLK